MRDIRIEHVAMYVKDLEACKHFFEEYFEATSGDKYHSVKSGFDSYFLSFEGGVRLELMNKSDLDECPKSLLHIGYNHLAFGVGSKEKVDALTRRLVDGGYQVLSGPRTTGDGYYESCIIDMEGNQIEITV